MKSSTESQLLQNAHAASAESDLLLVTRAVGRVVVTCAPPAAADSLVRATIAVSQFGQVIPVDMTGSLEQVVNRHGGLVQRLVERWFTCADSPNEHLIRPGEALRGPTLSGSSAADLHPTCSEAPVVADADTPTGAGSVRHRILEHLSKGPDNWYGIHRAVGTTKAQCILGLEKAWEDGLLQRQRVAGSRALARFALTEHGTAARRNGTLGWTPDADAYRAWDRWKPRPEPWTLQPCPVCGRDLREVSVGHLGDNWEHEDCLAAHCCHVDFAEVRLSGSKALMDMHYTALFSRGVLIGELASRGEIKIDVDHASNTTTRTVRGTEHRIARAVTGEELHDMLGTLLTFS